MRAGAVALRTRVRWCTLLLMSCGACACAATEGALLSRARKPDADGAGAGAAGRDGGSTAVRQGPVQAGMSVQYQISGTIDTSVDAQLFLVDLFDAPLSKIAELHAKGRVVIAYVSVGSLENWRGDVASFPQATIGMQLANYPRESWLDIRSPAVRSAMGARLDLARDHGFDGVFASTLGGYMENSGFTLTRSDELDYARFLANAAQSRSLSSGLSSDFEISELAAAFDWALAEGCIAGGFCDQLKGFIQQQKPVFDMETEGDQVAVCMKAATYGIPTTFKRSSYDAWRMPCM
jgi:hypothetical protein